MTTMTKQWWMREMRLRHEQRSRRLFNTNYAHYTVTVTAGQTHTLQSLGVSAETTVDWGDGLSNTYTGTSSRAHKYAATGTYTVKIMQPENVTVFDLRDNATKPVINSANLTPMTGLATLRLASISSGNIIIDTADLATINPTTLYFLSLTNANITVTPNSFSGYTACGSFYMQACNLSSIKVGALLYELYLASTKPRTAVGGTIRLDGNVAASGTFQACQNTPVSASTPGKEIAYELLHDSLGVGFNRWNTVITN